MKTIDQKEQSLQSTDTDTDTSTSTDTNIGADTAIEAFRLNFWLEYSCSHWFDILFIFHVSTII